MYDDAWYSAFGPTPQSQAEGLGHRRRQSLLRQPNEGNNADVEVAVETRNEKPSGARRSTDLPQATLARRAKSYGDFYDAVRAYLKKEHEPQKSKERRKNELRTEVDFQKWYHGVSQGLAESSNDDYCVYSDQLGLIRSHLDSMLDSTNSSLGLLSSLSDSFRAVEAQTEAFRAQCEDLLAEQSHLSNLADGIAENVQYYAYLDPMTRRLNAPGAGKFVRSREYSEMLSNLDRCLEYMQAHHEQREASTYRSRYRLLLTRALTLIRVHVTNALRELGADVSKRIADRQLTDTTMSTLLYAKFRLASSEMKQLGKEIHKRALQSAGAEPGAEAEYQSLMNELYQSYAATRGRLVLPIVSKRMKDIATAPNSARDLVAFARSSISYIRGICLDEYDLWREWFEDDDGLYDFLEALCEPLYDHLRPRTIRETQLLKLCELCTLLQTRYFEDEEEESEPRPPKRLEFSRFIHPALQDAQTRLVFLAMAIIRNEIEYYKPKPNDIDYPPHKTRDAILDNHSRNVPLSGKRNSTHSPASQTPKVVGYIEEEDNLRGPDATWSVTTKSANQNWYPTLKKAIWLLSNIYRLVNSTVFDDLAHQIVHHTTLSLQTAASQISQKASPVDAQLFLILHLLTLKQQIVAFDVEFVTHDVSIDFSSVTNTFWELRERGGLFNPANLIRLIGRSLIPRVVENMLDAKADLDGRLRTVINDFINAFTSKMTEAISESATGKPRFDGRAAATSAQAAISKEVPFLRQKLNEYFTDERTKEHLVAAVQDQVLQDYELFFERYTAQIRANGKAVSLKGKGREDEVWDPQTFAEWSDGVFRVRNMLGQPTDDGNASSRSLSASGTS